MFWEAAATFAGAVTTIATAVGALITLGHQVGLWRAIRQRLKRRRQQRSKPPVAR